MSGAVERSNNSSPGKDLETGAGKTPALSGKENFEGRPHPAEGGFVYFVSDGEAVKIGFSEKPTRRFHAIQSGHPKPLTLIGVASATVMGEREVQERFAHIHLRGEWFKAAPELIDFAITLCRDQTPPEIEPEPMPVVIQTRVMLLALAKREWPAQVSCSFQSVDWILTHIEQEPDKEEHRQSLVRACDGLRSNLEWWGRMPKPHAYHPIKRLPMTPQLAAFAKRQNAAESRKER